MPKRKKASKKAGAKKTTKSSTKSSSSSSVSKYYSKDSFYCQVNVTDYKKSIDFYTNVLELEPSDFSATGPDPATIGWYEFKLPVKGAMLGLGQDRNRDHQISRSTVFSVSDLDATYESLSKKGANPVDIIDIPKLISFFHVKDPDNNEIMFVGQPRVME